MSEFQDKVVIITGASGNLGQTAALTFNQLGAKVALVDINEDRLRDTYAALPEPDSAEIIVTNLIEADSVTDMCKQVIDKFGRLDCLANIAGGFTMGPLVQDTEDKDWDFMMNLNARSVFNTARACIPHMLENGGSIVNVSARVADIAKGKMAPYCASKGAVKTLTEALAAENKHSGIKVNCILPGTVDTPQNRADMPDADHSKWVSTQALTDVIVFLCSDASRAVNGAAIPVYGES